MHDVAAYDYALDAAQLIDACCRRLALLGNHHEPALSDLAIVLASTEQILHSHLISLLDDVYERELMNESGVDMEVREKSYSTLMITAARLQMMHSHSYQNEKSQSKEKNQDTMGLQKRLNSTSIGCNSVLPQALHSQVKRRCTFMRQSNSFVGPKEGGINTLLFHLITALQLCLLRIEDADAILSGDSDIAKRRSEWLIDELCEKEFLLSNDLFRGSQMWKCKERTTDYQPQNYHDDLSSVCAHKNSSQKKIFSVRRFFTFGLTGMAGHYFTSKLEPTEKKKVLNIAIRAMAAMILTISLKSKFLCWQVKARLLTCANSLSVWQHKWIIATTVMENNVMHKNVSYDKLIANPSVEDDDHDVLTKPASRYLLESIPLQSNKGAFWYNYGAFRFLLVRRAMDLVYASVGTAFDYTGPEGSFGLWMPIACAAASYYAIAGPDATSSRAARAVASPTTDMIKKTWGMISLPAIKRLSLDASKLLKGAYCADKIRICDVSCFVLSQNSFPALSTAVKRFHRQKDRKLSQLPTITESDDDSVLIRCHSLPQREDIPRKKLIFHLTGGGWFTHTIAGDIPYLLDWSRETDAVIICPEYALLPEHQFPAALNEIYNVYKALVSGEAYPLLGFIPSDIIITGESAGGNLAAALCVKFCKERLEAAELEAHRLVDNQKSENISETYSCIPSGIMLCCPALNMCSSPSPSRIMGVGDPILPTGLLNTIARAYSTNSCDTARDDPLISPYFASDEILSLFPPTIIFASTADPLLDDAVDFNTRLKRVGIESCLRSVQNMPHAFWGLGIAGFPEAKEVHKECFKWLNAHFLSDIS